MRTERGSPALRGAALLAPLLAAVLAGCGSAAGTTSSAKTPTTDGARALSVAQQQRAVEAAFRRRFRERFMEGEKRGFVHEPGQACRENGPGEGGNEAYVCEGWGSVPSAGGCILVTTEPATVAGVPSLQAEHLQRGQSPFAPGSCKIKGAP